MKVLVACEESQVVTKEFRKFGHDAYSCDIEPCSGGHPEWHLQQDVTWLLQQEWDMVIAFPPCTDLCASGARWWKEKRNDGRQQKSINFFMMFTKLNIPWSIENPVGLMSKEFRKPDQYIEPYQFGHPETKKTALWLNKLPKLKPTNIVEPNFIIGKNTGKKYSPTHYMSGTMSPGERAKLRSKTFLGIAKAMAYQWGTFF